MFEYIAHPNIRKAVEEGYALCKKEHNFAAFAGFLDALDLEPRISMRIVLDSLKEPTVLNEGIQTGLKKILLLSGLAERKTVHMVDGDEGIMNLDFAEPKPYHSTYMLANGPYGGKMECYSILGRTNGTANDGNPLIYALKRIKNWRLASADDFRMLLNYFVAACTSSYGRAIFEGVDYIVPVPSSAKINAAMVSCIRKYVNANIVTLDQIRKRSVDSVYDQLDYDALEILVGSQLYPGADTDSPSYNRLVQKVHNELQDARRKNEEANRESGAPGNPFAIKYVPPKYRPLIDSYVTGEFEDGLFKGKTVLIIDDSISTGKSITYMASEFILPKDPKEIRALTLLSPLMKI